jgi:hypothetical protein
MAGLHLNRWVEGGRRVLRLLGTSDGAGACDPLRHFQSEAELGLSKVASGGER